METTRHINKARPRPDSGSVTVLALLVLVILTLLGLGVLTSSSSDTRAAQNENIYRRNFSRAEAAVRAGMQALQDPDNDGTPANQDQDDNQLLRNYTPAWLNKATTQGVLPDPTNTSIWTSVQSTTVMDANCRYYVIETRIDGSLDATATQTRSYVVLGRSTVDNGEAIIRVGYRVRLPPLAT